MTLQDRNLITIALTYFSLRCENEAVSMEKMATEYPAQKDKCKANAAASRSLKAEADALLLRL